MFNIQIGKCYSLKFIEEGRGEALVNTIAKLVDIYKVNSKGIVYIFENILKKRFFLCDDLIKEISLINNVYFLTSYEMLWENTCVKVDEGSGNTVNARILDISTVKLNDDYFLGYDGYKIAEIVMENGKLGKVFLHNCYI